MTITFVDTLLKIAIQEKIAKKLSYRERQRLPDSAFAIPEERRYPIHDLCLHGDTLIPLLSGEAKPIKELCGKEVWVYSYDLDRRAVVPALARNVRKTIENAPVVEVLLDNNEKVICTDNHPFLTVDGKYVMAKELTPGMSLMPFYLKKVAYWAREHGQKLRKYYYEVYQPWYGFWDPVHHMVCRETTGLPKSSNTVVHHKDLNRFNNIPDNLEYMNRAAHCRLHAELSGHAYLSKLREACLRRWQNPENRKKQSEFMKRENLRRKLSGEIYEISRKITERKWKISDDEVRALHTEYLNGESLKNLAEKCSVTPTTIRDRFRRLNLPSKRELYANHKVVEVKPAGFADVYDMEVPGTNNFAVAAGIFVHNSHAKNALARVSQFGTPEERERVRRAVYARYPELKEQREEKIGRPMTKKDITKPTLPKK
ncbi:MAG: HNH endonuclease [Candidatus Aenigmatarchaeota archaeon]